MQLTLHPNGAITTVDDTLPSVEGVLKSCNTAINAISAVILIDMAELIYDTLDGTDVHQHTFNLSVPIVFSS